MQTVTILTVSNLNVIIRRQIVTVGLKKPAKPNYSKENKQ